MKSVDVLGTKYQISFGPINDDQEGFSIIGQTNSLTKEIALDPAKGDDEALVRTLLHEIIHPALIESGLSNLIEDPLQEAICDAIGGMLHTSGIGRQWAEDVIDALENPKA